MTVVFVHGIPESPPIWNGLLGELKKLGVTTLIRNRSAKQPALAELGREPAKPAARPGLALVAGEDHLIGSLGQREQAAALAGARVATLAGGTHFWLAQAPVVAAAAPVVAKFWAAA